MDVLDDMVDCTDVTNYAKYITAPLLIVQSTYDTFAMSDILNIDCLSNEQPPFSLQFCDEIERLVIEDYRNKTVVSLKKIREEKTNAGIWAPACDQHVFLNS